MRIVDYWVKNFPHPLTYDPYALFPGGQKVPGPPLFDLLIASTSLAAGGGVPSPVLVDRIGALFPAILGALAVIPLFLLGRALFGVRSGLAAAFLLAVFPGGFFLRTSLGFTDHHALEVLLSLGIWWAATICVDPASAPSRRRCATIGLGLLLALYLWTWAGGVFLILILDAFLLVQHLLDYRRGKWRRPLVSLPSAFVIAAAVILPGVWMYPQLKPSLSFACCSAAAAFSLNGFARWMSRRRVSIWIYLSALSGIFLAAASLGILWLRATGMPELVQKVLLLTDIGRQVGEFAPLFFPAGEFSLGAAWQQFSAPLAAALLALPFLVWRQRPKDARWTLLLVWSGTTLAATLAANRFVYYAAPPVALLAAAGAVRWVGLAPRWAAWWNTQRWSLTRRLASVPLQRSVLVLSVLMGLYLPALQGAMSVAGSRIGLDDEWRRALLWLRRNSPPPFGAEAAYYARYAPASDFRYPAGAYGVMNWWESGYWITRIAHRIPAANPTQRGADIAGRFLAEVEPARALEQLDAVGSGYIIVHRKALVTYPPGGRYVQGDFPAFLRWGGGSSTSHFFDIFYDQMGGGFRPFLVYYPDYYRSMAVRLYLYGGQAARPSDNIWVISFETKIIDGIERKVVTGHRRFSDSSKAASFLKGRDLNHFALVGLDPFATCVDLEALPRIRPVFASASGRFPEVRIFRVEK